MRYISFLEGHFWLFLRPRLRFHLAQRGFSKVSDAITATWAEKRNRVHWDESRWRNATPKRWRFVRRHDTTYGSCAMDPFQVVWIMKWYQSAINDPVCSCNLWNDFMFITMSRCPLCWDMLTWKYDLPRCFHCKSHHWHVYHVYTFLYMGWMIVRVQNKFDWLCYNSNGCAWWLM